MVLLDVPTGLRQSELFALKWKDVDFSNKQLWVTRSIVQQVVGRCKTGGSTETRAASRSSDQFPAQLESQNALSNTGKLGVRSPQNRGKKTVLGTTTSSSSHPSRREKAGHHEAVRVAYVSQNVLHIAAGYRCRTEGHAGTDAAFDDPRHPRHLPKAVTTEKRAAQTAVVSLFVTNKKKRTAA